MTSYLGKLDEIDAKGVSTLPIRGTDDIVARVGRYGPYLERLSDGKRTNIPPELAPDELTAETVAGLIEGTQELALGQHPDTGLELVARVGRYGPYVEEVLGEDAPAKATSRKASLFKSMSVDTLTLEQAVDLLALPREVGVDPESGEPITAQNGRYGPYLKRGTDTRSLASEDLLLTITLDDGARCAQAAQTWAGRRGHGGTSARGRSADRATDRGPQRPLRPLRNGRGCTTPPFALPTPRSR